MGGFGRSCDRGNGGADPADPRLAAAPAVAPMISFACEPERGLVAGSLVVDAVEGDIVVSCSCCF